MSKIPSNPDGLNDADLASLFSSDTIQPPKDLDKIILNNAQVSQYDLLPRQRKTFTQQYAPLIAVAAVLMIAIGLTPLTMNAPESQPDLALGPAPTPEPLATTADSGVGTSIAESSVEATESKARIIKAESNVQITTAESSSAETEPTAAISTAVPPMPETDSDASGIDADENMTYEPEQSKDKQISLEDISNEEELRLNKTVDDAEKTDEPKALVAESSDTDSAMKEELSSELSAEVATVDSTPKTEIAGETELLQRNMAESDFTELNKEDGSQAPSINPINTNPINTNPINTIELQKNIVDLQDNEIKQQNKTASSTLAQDAQDILGSTRSEASGQELSLIAEQDSALAVIQARMKAKNYRSSALLWVIQIKHLYNEKLIVEAKEELTLLRKKFPDNDNERLLPKEFLDSIPE